MYMNHKGFEGLVNSGDFNQIDHKLQQPIQDIYGKIDIHDEYVKKIVELENGSTKEEEYVLILNGNEKNLLASIPPVMKELDIFDDYCESFGTKLPLGQNKIENLIRLVSKK
jgi:hypothetical protein